ncbi:MAG TPA: mannose-6-phosphate isomerase, class I, partial [Cellulomonadaceae bacterium]|nr:mannose-6-phosphate isomerase, class I [Cellulomonadaceae bacterium]
ALVLLLTAAPGEQRTLARAVQDAAQARAAQHPAYQLVADLALHHPGDIGLVVSVFLNALRLEPGEAVFLGAGTLHSYVHGLGVELMATSDNVVRAGLTTKHVNVPELLRLTDFTPGAPAKLDPRAGTGSSLTFSVPVPDFALWTLTGPAPDPVDGPPAGARIVLCVRGRAAATCGRHTTDLRAGESVFVQDGDGPLTVTTSGIVAVAHQPGVR